MGWCLEYFDDTNGRSHCRRAIEHYQKIIERAGGDDRYKEQVLEAVSLVTLINDEIWQEGVCMPPSPTKEEVEQQKMLDELERSFLLDLEQEAIESEAAAESAERSRLLKLEEAALASERAAEGE